MRYAPPGEIEGGLKEGKYPLTYIRVHIFDSVNGFAWVIDEVEKRISNCLSLPMALSLGPKNVKKP